MTCSWWGKCSKCGRFDMLGAPVTLTIPEGLLQMYEKMAEPPRLHTWMNGQDAKATAYAPTAKPSNWSKPHPTLSPPSRPPSFNDQFTQPRGP